MNESNLILGLLGMPPESARNCVQEIYPIPNGEFKKTVNGDLLFLESTSRKKYKSIISCKDMNCPIIDGIWIGTQLNVGCIQNLWQSIDIGHTKTKLIRPPVKGSISTMNFCGESIDFTTEDNEVSIKKSHQEKIFVCFRPWLTMQVIDFSLHTNEWGMTGGWKIILEEI